MSFWQSFTNETFLIHVSGIIVTALVLSKIAQTIMTWFNEPSESSVQGESTVESEEHEAATLRTSSTPAGQDSNFQADLMAENCVLKEQIENLKHENKMLLSKISEDLGSYSELKKNYERDKEKWRKDVKDGEEIIKRLLRDKMQLIGEVRNLKKESKLCGRNCVNCCIQWVSKHNWNIDLCCPQLAVLFIWHARATIDEMHVKCEEAMKVLLKCGIVHLDTEYILPQNSKEKFRKTNDIWNGHMRIREKFLLMGIHYPEPIGHAVICIVDKQNKEIIICDAQAEEKVHLDKKEFIHLVNNPNIVGVQLYSVNLEYLRKILKSYYDIDVLHITGKHLDVHPSFHLPFQPCEPGSNEHESE